MKKCWQCPLNGQQHATTHDIFGGRGLGGHMLHATLPPLEGDGDPLYDATMTPPMRDDDYMTSHQLAEWSRTWAPPSGRWFRVILYGFEGWFACLDTKCSLYGGKCGRVSTCKPDGPGSWEYQNMEMQRHTTEMTQVRHERRYDMQKSESKVLTFTPTHSCPLSRRVPQKCFRKYNSVIAGLSALVL